MSVTAQPPVRIEVWSDIACPWCLLGNAHLQTALDQSGIEADVEMRSYQLAPQMADPEPAKQYLAKKFGSAEQVEASHARLKAMGESAGLCYNFDEAIVANTFDGHRLHHYAKSTGQGAEMMERLLHAQHQEGLDVSSKDVLRRLAADAGLDPAAVDEVLDSDAYAEGVQADIAEARAIGVQGVPFFVFDRKFALSGAQPVDVFMQALASARDGEQP